jgi:hypothetical protein
VVDSALAVSGFSPRLLRGLPAGWPGNIAWGWTGTGCGWVFTGSEAKVEVWQIVQAASSRQADWKEVFIGNFKIVSRVIGFHLQLLTRKNSGCDKQDQDYFKPAH